MLEWFAKELLKNVAKSVSIATKEGAEAVQADAKRILMSAAKRPSGHLASEIEIYKSKYKDGGYLVWAQGPVYSHPYHAIFVELGTDKNKPSKRRKHDMPAIPYMRPALKRNKAKIESAFEGKLR